MTAALSNFKLETILSARKIPALSHTESGNLAMTEYERVLTVLESLEGDDWKQPTFCTKWNVRDMVAHLAGACAAYASWAEFRRQMIQNPYSKEVEVQVDGINQCQLMDRADRTPSELVAEFRDVGPKAIRTRQRLPWILRSLIIPFGPPLGTKPVHYLTDTVYTRDQWMHRYDLSHATGKAMTVSAEHDGRIVALVVRDLAELLARQLEGRSVDLILTGSLEGSYRLGSEDDTSCSISMDVFDFALLTSDRITPAEASERIYVDGNTEFAKAVLTNFSVPY